MHTVGRVGRVAVTVGLLAGLAHYWVACGDDPAVPATFQGNVETVMKMAMKPQSRWFAGAPRFDRWLSRIVPEAVAQAECSEQTEGVLACAATFHFEDEEGDLEDFCRSLLFDCEAVRTETCQFVTSIRILGPDESGLLFFVQDEDGDGTWDFNVEDCASEEPSAVLQNGPQPVCNGDLILTFDVDVDFNTGTAVAREVEKEIDGCPEGARTSTPTPAEVTPTPTVEGTPAPTPTEGTPAPTPTGGTPEPTPTAGGCAGPGAQCTSAEQCCSGICLPGLNVCSP